MILGNLIYINLASILQKRPELELKNVYKE